MSVDNLGVRDRQALVRSMRECMQEGQESVERRWSIPTTPRALSFPDTYAFSSTQPSILMASMKFPLKDTTRDAFLIALRDRNPDTEKPIRIAFEFNIGRRSNQNRNNIRLEGGAGKPIIVRCRGSFAHDAVRLKADEFFSFLGKDGRIEDSPGITLETIDNKTYARIIELDGPDVSRCWPELVRRLSWLATVVTEFKTSPDRE